MSLLEVKNLEVTFGLRTGPVIALRDVSFSVDKGERLGIVGESGAGKSVAGFSIINLISNPGKITKGKILFNGADLTKYNDMQMRDIRGNSISMIFQDPIMTLNPVLTVGTQLVETILTHNPKMSKRKAKEIAIEKLKKVYIPSPEKRYNQYPFELSGGMRQRVVIASALVTNPKIIIADEPTTALDVTIQAEIMSLLRELCENEDMGMVLITHDLSVVAQMTQKTIVMYAGKIVEMGNTRDIIDSPRHPYTKGLLKALPQECNSKNRLNQIPGSMPTLTKISQGCSFHPRCEYKKELCEQEDPGLIMLKDQKRMTSCHFAEEIS